MRRIKRKPDRFQVFTVIGFSIKTDKRIQKLSPAVFKNIAFRITGWHYVGNKSKEIVRAKIKA